MFANRAEKTEKSIYQLKRILGEGHEKAGGAPGLLTANGSTNKENKQKFGISLWRNDLIRTWRSGLAAH